MESACDPEAESGEWLAALDVVEAGSSLRLAPQPGPGHCASECRTLARACALALGDHDTDVAEALFTRPPNAFGRAHLERLLCHDLSPACAKPAPPVPASRPPGPAFRAKTQQEVDMDKMMRKMRSVPGMPGMSMYSRDDLAGLAAEAGGEGEEYEEEGGEGAGGGGGGGDGEGAGGAGGAGGGVGGAGLAGWAQSAAGAASRAVDAAVHAAVGLAQRAWGWAERLGGGGGAAREGGAQEL